MNDTLMTVLVLLVGLFAIISLGVYVNNRNSKRDTKKNKD